MKSLISIAWRSAWHRRFGLSLVVFTVALSSFLLLAVERVRHDVRTAFSQSVSGTDLIVGARTGSVQLLLYSVFRIGSATNNIRWSSVKALEEDRAVDWVVPLSLGDSHRGFPVVATTGAYFQHFRYGERRPLSFTAGGPFGDVFDTVLGADVAAQLGYRLGDALVLRHGSGPIAGADHADMPFTVVGILARTGTPVDRSVHIGLDGMEAIHLDWVAGVPMPGKRHTDAAAARQLDLTPRTVTAALVGLKSRAAVFGVQRRIAAYDGEPLLAILPGVALDELWDAVGAGERALLAMSVLVGIVSLAGLVAVVVTGLEQRRHELAVLRSVGARPAHVFWLLLVEGIGLTLAGAIIGLAGCVGIAAALGPWVQQQFGLAIGAGWPSAMEWTLLAGVIGAGAVASLLPGWRAYAVSLADGLSPKG